MGDSTEVDRLEIVIDANFSKLNEQLNGLNRAVHGSAKKIEEDFSAINIEKALSKVFDSTRLAVIDAGAEKLRVFGSALEPLGALGLAAGAGIAAFGASLEVAEKTGEWAVELSHLSEKLGVTTEQVQQFDYVWTESGIGIEKGREAIAALNVEFGKAQAGLLTAKSAKPFEALGFGSDPAAVQKSLLQYQDVQELLEALPARFDKLGSAAEKAATAQRLGMEALVVIMHAGAGGYDELLEKVSNYGYMSKEAVAHAVRLNEELQTAKLRTHEAANALGADMLPVLVKLQDALTRTILGFRRLWDMMTHGKTPTENVVDLLDRAHKAQANAEAARSGGAAPGGGMMLGRNRQAYVQQQEQLAHDLIAQANAINDGQIAAAQADAKAEEEEKARSKPKADLDPSGRNKGVPGEAFGGLQKDASDKVDSAAKAYALAMAAMTEDVVAKAAYEKQGVAAELAKQTADLKEAQEKVSDDKKLSATQKAQLKSSLELAQLGNELTAIAKAELIDRKTQQALREQARALSDQETTNRVDMLKSQEALAVGSKQRSAIALQLFDLEEQLLKSKLEEVLASTETSDAQKQIAQLQLDGLNATKANRRKAIADQTAGPLAKYTKDLSDQTGAGISDSLQKVEVQGLQDINSGLAKAIVNAKDFGQAFSNALRQVETDLVNLALEKYLTLPLAQALGLAGGGIGSLFGGASVSGGASSSFIQDAFSFGASTLLTAATGTDYSPGGMTLVGENGQEILNVPKGAQVIPNNLIGASGVPAGITSGGPSLYIDNRGAVMTQDLVDSMNQSIAAAEQRSTANGAAMGLAAARALVPAEMSRRAGLQIR